MVINNASIRMIMSESVKRNMPLRFDLNQLTIHIGEEEISTIFCSVDVVAIIAWFVDHPEVFASSIGVGNVNVLRPFNMNVHDYVKSYISDDKLDDFLITKEDDVCLDKKPAVLYSKILKAPDLLMVAQSLNNVENLYAPAHASYVLPSRHDNCIIICMLSRNGGNIPNIRVVRSELFDIEYYPNEAMALKVLARHKVKEEIKWREKINTINEILDC